MAKRTANYQPLAFSDNPLLLRSLGPHWSWRKPRIRRPQLSATDQMKKLLDVLVQNSSRA